ncbi:MAG: hypothetical protein WB421_14090 [Terriglobales bacterium]|jgi:hypothetical protein
MSSRIPKRALLGFAAILALAAIVSAQVSAESGIRSRYGTRDPVSCGSRKEPVTGAISEEQARRYFTCGLESKAGIERTDGQVFLVEELKLKVGEAAPEGSAPIPDAAGISAVYPISGSFVLYACVPISTTPLTYNKGKNCSVKTQPNANGWCYKNINGDWRCDMIDTRNRTMQIEMPPPATP